MKIRKRHITLFLGIALLDLVLYLLISFYLMKYEDFYDESEGAYWSLTSMTLDEKIAYLSLQFLIVINIALVVYVFIRFIKNLNITKLPKK